MGKFSVITCILFTCLITIACGTRKNKGLQPIVKRSGDTTQTVNAPTTRKIVQADSTASLPVPSGDSIPNQDSTKKVKIKSVFDDPVIYEASDSLVFDVRSKWMYLYDTAKVNYQKIELTANYMVVNMETKLLVAQGTPDSTQKLRNKPIFKEGDKSFSSSEIRYNFNSRKGIIQNVVTQEGEIYLHGQTAKKDSLDILHIKHAKFTTCNDPEHPHFWISARKAMVIPNDKVVTGPANLMIEGIPTPLVVPFGFFPIMKNRTSGLILPEYGELTGYGFFLRKMGYYFAINDRIDLTLMGDIYTSLSFGARGILNYKQRYKHGGNVSLEFSQLQSGDPQVPSDFRQARDFRISWKHTQDPKAHPSFSFNATVNIATRSFNKLNSTSVTGIVQNNLSSNIMLTKSFPGTPINLSVSVRHDQNIANGQMTIILPDFFFNVNRFYPFKRKKQIGELRWYENIGMTYSMNMRNDLRTIDTLFTRDPAGVFSRVNSGILHRASIATNVKILKFFTVNPSVNYTEKWHLFNLQKNFNPLTQKIEDDTVRGFFTTRDMNVSTSLTTILYGFFTFKKGPVKAIRHVMTPSASFTYRPDLGDFRSGYFGPNGEFTSYSPNQIGLFGSSPLGQSGIIAFNVNNTLDMKVNSKKDTVTGERKVPILEVFNLNMSYDLARDSLNWSNLNLTGRTSFFNNMLGLNFAFSFDPYAIDTVNGLVTRVGRTQIAQNGEPFRFTQASLNMNFSYRGKPRNGGNSNRSDELQRMNNQSMFGYSMADFSIPYSFTIGYNIAYNKPLDRDFITHTIQIQADVNITPKWKVAMNLNYDLQNNQITTSSLDIYRDLHCWEMRFSMIPFGFRQSYMFTINVKSSILQMLKFPYQNGWNSF